MDLMELQSGAESLHGSFSFPPVKAGEERERQVSRANNNLKVFFIDLLLCFIEDQ